MNYKQAGLVPAGKNEDGEKLFIGTREQWDKTEILPEVEAIEGIINKKVVKTIPPKK